jgi:ELWxxDGT repeat protein
VVVTEGTAVSTHLVPGLLPRNQVREFFNVAGRRYFRSCEAEHGCELWSTDRLGEDLRLVADVWPGQGSGDPEILAVDGNTIWFAATAPSVGREFWKIDVQ